jgi:hypothetical protein
MPVFAPTRHDTDFRMLHVEEGDIALSVPEAVPVTRRRVKLESPRSCKNRPFKSFTNFAGANRTVRFSVFLRTVVQRLQHMLKYCTGLHLVGIGHAFPDSSNHFAHEQIVFQAHSPRNGVFKGKADIVGANAGRDRHKRLRTLLRYLANGL